MYLRGISQEYVNYAGSRVCVSWPDRLQLLREMGDDPDDENSVKASIYQLDARPWLTWLQSLHILSKGISEYIDVRLHPDRLNENLQWQVITELGEILQGDFIPSSLEEVGNYYIDDVRYTARRLRLNDLPTGYHQLSVTNGHDHEKALIIVAPPSSFECVPEHRKIWGINCQLYTLRSERNWGIGDFTDLQELISHAAAVGMDLISLNPMHAPNTSTMDIASPYSPSDRRYLNPLYIDPEQVPEFDDSKPLHLNSRMQLETQISSLREQRLLNYYEVAQLKYSIFDQMFQYFLEFHLKRNSSRGDSFNDYIKDKGNSLAEFALFESRYFKLEIQSAADPRFHQYLQWLVEEQFSSCQHHAKQKGMSIGLMKDLAVGAVSDGAEVLGNLELYCQQATIGAPPDPLAEQGQNWQLPALDPIALKESNYQLFIELLRANMSACGGLRIDHVLGLLRLWWCHPDIDNGAYVYYPMEDLLAILCLESHRHACLVVGEDMGTVPGELTTALKSKSIYSNKVFYFEKNQDQSFKQPQSHERDALFMITNHDVPTLAGWWDCTDLLLRQEIGLLHSGDEFDSAFQQRQQEKSELLFWLQSQQLLPEDWDTDSQNRAFDKQLRSAILIACARSQSRMMLLQLDDLQLLHKPVNIPGTHREYPNWRRKQKLTIQCLFNDDEIKALLASIKKERPRS